MRTWPALSAVLDTLVVDKDMDLPTLVSLFQAVRSVSDGNGQQFNVPVSGLPMTLLGFSRCCAAGDRGRRTGLSVRLPRLRSAGSM